MKKTKRPILYGCPICKELFDTRRGAESCRDQSYDTCGWKVGEVLLIPGCRQPSHVSEDSPWFAFTEPAWPKSSSHFDHVPNQHFWFVVVGLYGESGNPHRLLVVVYSGGGPRFGWNPCDGYGHHALFRPGIDPLLQKHTSMGSCWADPEQIPDGKFLRDKIMELKPPTGLMDLPEVQLRIEQFRKSPGSIHLL